MRLFVALFLPDDVAAHLDHAVRRVQQNDGSGQRQELRWVRPEQRHLTLAFYGATPSAAVDALVEDLNRPSPGHGPLTLRLRGAGTFGPRVLWAGVNELHGTNWSDHVEGLTSLMAYCNEVGTRHIPDLQPRAAQDLRPHLTLARARDPRRHRRALNSAVAALSNYAGPRWTATEAHLVRSEPGKGAGGGARYTTLGVVPLHSVRREGCGDEPEPPSQ